MKLFAWTLAAFISGLVLTEPDSVAAVGNKRHFLQAGMLTTYLGGAATTDQGTSTKTIHRFYPALGFRMEFGQSRLKWTPSIQITPIPKKSQDDAISIHLVKVSLAPTYRLAGPIEFTLGPGVLYQFMFGNGGTVELQNGTSTTSFFRPATNSTMRLLFLEGGLGFHFSRIRFDFIVFTTGFMSSQLAWHAGGFLGWGIL